MNVHCVSFVSVYISHLYRFFINIECLSHYPSYVSTPFSLSFFLSFFLSFSLSLYIYIYPSKVWRWVRDYFELFRRSSPITTNNQLHRRRRCLSPHHHHRLYPCTYIFRPNGCLGCCLWMINDDRRRNIFDETAQRLDSLSRIFWSTSFYLLGLVFFFKKWANLGLFLFIFVLFSLQFQ